MHQVKVQVIRFSSTYERGWGNGYVGVSESHPLYKVEYFDIEQLEVHGGLTFSSFVEASRKSEWGELSGMWVFGFDTVHLGDNKVNCNQEYVERQTASLAMQLMIK